MPKSDYVKVEQAIRFLQARAQDQPGLDEVAAEVGLSAFHFQRLFQRWAGVSPKRFLQFLTLEEAKRMLAESRSLLETSHAVAYGGLAALSGALGASRAVGTALGQNPIAWLIPCHRVLQSTGALGQYHWGAPRKQAMLAFERAQLEGQGA
jgi:O-6-methylguanine DNA methyltransferase